MNYEMNEKLIGKASDNLRIVEGFLRGDRGRVIQLTTWALLVYVVLYAARWSYVSLNGDIHSAASWGATWRMNALIAADSTIVDSADERGLTPLHMAAIHDERSAAQLLIDKGASKPARALDDWQTDGGTALHAAVLEGHEEMVELLLEAGVPHNVHDNLVRYPLHWAAVRDDEEMALMLLNHGAYPKLKDTHQNTPLHLAAMCGSFSVARTILNYQYRYTDYVPEVDDPGLYGDTIIQTARKYGHEDIVDLLLEHGADKRHLQVQIMPRRRRAAWWADIARFNEEMSALP
jgi:ankyrin repeat protein